MEYAAVILHFLLMGFYVLVDDNCMVLESRLNLMSPLAILAHYTIAVQTLVLSLFVQLLDAVRTCLALNQFHFLPEQLLQDFFVFSHYSRFHSLLFIVLLRVFLLIQV